MLWVISCISKPNAEAIRHAAVDAHRDYLNSREDMLLLSGPLQNDDGSANIGVMFVINANSRAEAQAFSDGEGFTKAGMFSSVTITRLRKGRFNPKVIEQIG